MLMYSVLAGAEDGVQGGCEGERAAVHDTPHRRRSQGPGIAHVSIRQHTSAYAIAYAIAFVTIRDMPHRRRSEGPGIANPDVF